jgi:hypothetical protein
VQQGETALERKRHAERRLLARRDDTLRPRAADSGGHLAISFRSMPAALKAAA